MDPDQQEAINDVRNSVYRTALKVRSVQILCQLVMTDVSQIQHILCQRAKQSSLTTQQLSQLLKQLFQNVKLDRLGQIDPQAPEFTLKLLTSMYDRSGTGFIKARSAAAALIVLSGDSLLPKYKALFQLYADPDGKGTLITRSAMRSLLTDLHQIPTVVGESCGLSCVEIAIQSCFHGVLNSAIGEEKFLFWLQSEPGLLLWLPTCYRLSATEMVTHHVQCSVCKNFPITGLRYRCLKCLNFDLCQVCFFTDRHRKPHKRSHPVMEYCGQQMSAKENAKIFFRTLRNNLLQERCRRKEAQRRQMLEMFWEVPSLHHEQAQPSAELSIFPQPAHHYLSSPAYSPTLWLPKHLPEKAPAMQLTENNNREQAQDKTSAQTIASIKAELLKAHESVNVLHCEKRYLRKQLNKWKDKMLLLHNSQDAKNCQLDAKLQVLIATHESMRVELQQMRQEIKEMLKPPNHPSFVLCQNTMPKSEDPWEERKLHSGSPSTLAMPMPTSYTESKSLDPSSAGKRHLLETQMDPVAIDPISGTTWGSIFLQNANSLMREHEKSKEKGIPPTDQEGMSELERTRNLPQGTVTITCSPTAAEVPFHKEEKEEEEFQQLLLKLKDALSVQLQPAHQCTMKEELFSTAEHVCRSFSNLINHVTLPS
ncbi:dystrotelin [Carettochelys insculpta]|uniref:dystrotelin n=1 Tax=Carettochelys insculpta TaxID=44489 RepID=UPI003EBA0052